MPALPPVPDCVSVILNLGTGTDKSSITRLHWSYSGGAPTTANCLTLATAISTAWNTNMPGYYHPDVELLNVTVSDLASSTGASAEYAANIVGTRSGGPLPAGAAPPLQRTGGRETH